MLLLCRKYSSSDHPTHICTGGQDAHWRTPFEVTLKLSLIVDVFVLLLRAFR